MNNVVYGMDQLRKGLFDKLENIYPPLPSAKMLGGKTAVAAVVLYFAPRHVVILIPRLFGHVIPAPIVLFTIAAGGGRPFAKFLGENPRTK
jgi:hypothetical protein